MSEDQGLDRPHKFSRLVGWNEVEHVYPRQFLRRVEPDGARIEVGVPSGDTSVFERLARVLRPPYGLLYVLHTPRGDQEPGRYQSEELSAEEFATFYARFGMYLARDARFDFWLHAPEEAATLVWDRHNILFAYGPLDRFEQDLIGQRFTPGAVDVPVPHAHHYHAVFDQDAREILAAISWRMTPLEPEDEQ